MTVLTDPFTPANFPDLFTWMWVAGIVIGLFLLVRIAIPGELAAFEDVGRQQAGDDSRVVAVH